MTKVYKAGKRTKEQQVNLDRIVAEMRSKVDDQRAKDDLARWRMKQAVRRMRINRK